MPPSNRSALLVSTPDPRDVQALVAAVSDANIEVDLVASVADARTWMESKEPLAVLAPAPGPDFSEICLRTRANPALSLVPIIGLATQITDLTFVDVLGAGGDDAALLSRPDAIVRRLRLLPKDLPLAAPSIGQTVLLADADDKRRVLLARVLRNAGFGVQFAVHSDELADPAKLEKLDLVIADVDLHGAVEALERVRAAPVNVPWVLAAPPKKLSKTAEQIERFAKVALYDVYGPLENVLFVANELLFGRFSESRATPRLLYTTTIAFRLAGRDRDEFGVSYNVSGDGLYVRTMAPLNPGDDVWIELQSPRSDRRVRLEGKVAWRRGFAPPRGATAPPGFGVRICGGSDTDIKRYREGYQAFAAAIGTARVREVPA